MKELFEKARKENLWFYTTYQDMWFSPDQLEKQQAEGKFNWGAENFQLRDPWEKVAELETLINNTTKEKRRWIKNIMEIEEV